MFSLLVVTLFSFIFIAINGQYVKLSVHGLKGEKQGITLKGGQGLWAYGGIITDETDDDNVVRKDFGQQNTQLNQDWTFVAKDKTGSLHYVMWKQPGSPEKLMAGELHGKHKTDNVRGSFISGLPTGLKAKVPGGEFHRKPMGDLEKQMDTFLGRGGVLQLSGPNLNDEGNDNVDPHFIWSIGNKEIKMENVVFYSPAAYQQQQQQGQPQPQGQVAPQGQQQPQVQVVQQGQQPQQPQGQGQVVVQQPQQQQQPQPQVVQQPQQQQQQQGGANEAKRAFYDDFLYDLYDGNLYYDDDKYERRKSQLREIQYLQRLMRDIQGKKRKFRF